MAEAKTDEQVIFFKKIETSVSMDEDTYEINEEELMTDTKRLCTVYNIPTNTGIQHTDDKKNKQQLPEDFKLKAYKYTDQIEGESIVKIGVYANINEYIYEDLWYIKLSLKTYKEEECIYVNFIRSLNTSLLTSIVTKINTIGKYNIENSFKYFFDTDNICKIIKNIATQLHISKIILQDDADFPCNNDLGYGIKAVQLRALMTNTDIESNSWYLKQDIDQEGKPVGKSKLSIYQKSGFTPVNYTITQITGCIKLLQNFTCNTLKSTAEKLKKLLTRINDKDITYAIYKIKIIEQENNLNIQYEEVKENNYSSICRDYIRNLDLLISIFSEGKDQTIYKYYESVCNPKEDESCCKIRGDILGSLRNSVNRNVIIIKGIKKDMGKKDNDQQCYGNVTIDMKNKLKITNTRNQRVIPIRSLSETPPTTVPTSLPMIRASSGSPTITVPNDPIIVTKLFNLFYGTFEKLKYIFSKMELNLTPTQGAVAAVE
jgi:hypothetical protein